jgi:hypothetical protein
MHARTYASSESGRNTEVAFNFAIPFPCWLVRGKNREGLNVSGSSNTFGSMTRTLSIGASGFPALVQISNILDVTEHARAFGDIISTIYISFSCCMWYA